ncbi:MAG: transposase [Saccharofermentans sp.]|nr:transposase [Saccharofermentans sp.]
MALSDVRKKVSSVEINVKASEHNNGDLPLNQKYLLSLEEAAEYSGIGINKLREISNENNCCFVMWVGNHRKFKRKLFEKWLDETYSC